MYVVKESSANIESAMSSYTRLTGISSGQQEQLSELDSHATRRISYSGGLQYPAASLNNFNTSVDLAMKGTLSRP